MILDNLASGNCIPFIIGEGPSPSGPRIGGAPPEGVSSSQSGDAHYLLTIALEEDASTELSIFLHPDWWDIVLDHSRTLYSQKENWVEFVVHGPTFRCLHDNHKPLLIPHPLIFAPTESDRQDDDSCDEPGAPLWEHKLGGKSYFVRYNRQLTEAVQEMGHLGYRQLLQLTFPGPKDGDIAGSWPFVGGIFYLFVKRDEGQYQWRYGWLY